jgi:hypothetical protein
MLTPEHLLGPDPIIVMVTCPSSPIENVVYRCVGAVHIAGPAASGAGTWTRGQSWQWQSIINTSASSESTTCWKMEHENSACRTP